jgi:hypothetical protein
MDWELDHSEIAPLFWPLFDKPTSEFLIPSADPLSIAALRGLAPLIGPVAFLSEFGDAESIEQEAARLQMASDILIKIASVGVEGDILGATSTPDTVAAIGTLSQWIDQLRQRSNAAKIASLYLERNGWRFDRETKKVYAVEKNRGRNFLVLCIQALSTEGRNDEGNRREIARFLSRFFTDDLDPGPRGIIARAIENIKRQPIRRRKTPAPKPL